MTSDVPNFPLLRGRVLRAEPFINPQNAVSDAPELPIRDPALHRARLLGMIDGLSTEVGDRNASERVQGATREVISVTPQEGYKLTGDGLGDKRADVRVVAVDESGRVLLDAQSADLTHLRRKLDQYVDAGKLSKSGRPRNEAALAPVDRLSLASFEDRADELFLPSQLGPGEHRWFEISCRGGTRFDMDSDESRRQIRIALGNEYLVQHRLQEFESSERIHFYVYLPPELLRMVVERTDCVYEFDLVEPQIRRFLFLEDQDAAEVGAFVLRATEGETPTVALLDTGVAAAHPLVQPAMKGAISAVPGDDSPADADGHGTSMVGLLVYGDALSDALEQGEFRSEVWVESGRLLAVPQQGSAAEVERAYWPATTQLAMERLEELNDEPRRVFCMPVGAENDLRGAPTGWSAAIDELAFDGRRVICLAVGNAETSLDQVDGYPRANLVVPIVDPAQSVNAISVGAYTEWETLPPDGSHGSYRPVATAGQISPHTSAGTIGTAMKPEVVFEGGNLFTDGVLPTIADTASYLSAGRAVFNYPLSMIAGTSAATAIAARFAAQLWRANPDLSPETVRGLVVHAASWTPEMLQQFPDLDERLSVCGLGVPDLTFAIRCATNRATVVYESQMASRTELTGATRETRLFSLPLPDFLSEVTGEAEVRVTLSYFAEPRRRRRNVRYGLDFRWDMQGPAESEEVFLQRINRAARPDRARKRARTSSSYDWTLGRPRRSRGTVQSDRWHGPAALLASSKLLAVYPVRGWWDDMPDLRLEELPFSLIVTVRTAADVNLYEPISNSLMVAVDAS